MKWFALLFLASLVLRAADNETNWSQPVKGLRARLFFQPSQEPELDKTFDVMIEFQEVGIETSLGRTHGDVTIRFGKTDPDGVVTDAQGHVIPPNGQLDMDFITSQWDLVLPERGRLIFPIGAGGGRPHVLTPGQTPTSGIPLEVGLMKRWNIPSSGGPYYLSVSLTVPPQSPAFHQERYRGWTGKLILPPVEIPEK